MKKLINESQKREIRKKEGLTRPLLFSDIYRFFNEGGISMLNEVKDFFDTSVCMVILIDSVEGLSVLAETIVSIGKERCTYEVYKDDITDYMMELRMPYSRYFAMMKGLQQRGWNLAEETKVGIFNRLYKEKS